MADNEFRKVLVWDVLPGGTVRTLRNGTVTVHDATGIPPESAGTGTVLDTLTSDAQGTVTFTHPTITTVDFVSPNGFVQRVTSEASVAVNAAAAQLAALQAQTAAQQTLPIVDNGDGTLTASNPDSPVVDNGDGTLTYSSI